MFGLAQTNKFMLGAATVMIGAQADLFNLTRAANSVGLVKNFKLQTKPSFVDLTQGVQNTLVYSVLNGNTVSGSAELYEYTPKNMAYLAQNAGFVTITGASTTLSAAVTGSTGTPAATFSVASATGFAANDWVLIADPAFPDDAIVRQIASIATNVITPTLGIGRNLSAGATVTKMSYTKVGAKDTPPFYSAMITGQLADGSNVAVALPKIRLTGGLNISFMTNDYGNMPLEFQVYDLVSTDPNFSIFGNTPAGVYTQ